MLPDLWAQCVYLEVVTMMLLGQAFQVSQNSLTLILTLLVDVLVQACFQML